MLVGVGVFDTAANVFVATATTHGAAGIVAVLSALYPMVTVVLAWIVLGERPSATKRAAESSPRRRRLRRRGLKEEGAAGR